MNTNDNEEIKEAIVYQAVMLAKTDSMLSSMVDQSVALQGEISKVNDELFETKELLFEEQKEVVRLQERIIKMQEKESELTGLLADNEVLKMLDADKL